MFEQISRIWVSMYYMNQSNESAFLLLIDLINRKALNVE